MLAKAPPLPPIALLGKPMLLESPSPKPVTNPTALPSPPPKPMALPSPPSKATAALAGPKPTAAPPPKRAAKPAPPARQVYVIRRGESLADIAERYRVSLPSLRSVNGLNTNQLRVPVGTPITIPAGDS
jgi:N-acetylmuramoyl-L-alanine amidase